MTHLIFDVLCALAIFVLAYQYQPHPVSWALVICGVMATLGVALKWRWL